jgi:hypothetical protein
MFGPRSFAFTYSPLFALGGMIVAIYAMAIVLGLSMGVHPEQAGSYKLFLVSASPVTVAVVALPVARNLAASAPRLISARHASSKVHQASYEAGHARVASHR